MERIVSLGLARRKALLNITTQNLVSRDCHSSFYYPRLTFAAQSLKEAVEKPHPVPTFRCKSSGYAISLEIHLLIPAGPFLLAILVPLSRPIWLNICKNASIKASVGQDVLGVISLFFGDT